MNCAEPTDFRFSFRGFRQRGGDTDKHSHGWGLAIYEGKGGGLRTFLDTLPASESPIAELVVARYPIKTYNCMAHIRYATQGSVSLENVHPFQREMVRIFFLLLFVSCVFQCTASSFFLSFLPQWGIQWSFCHNGDVPKFASDRSAPLLGKTPKCRQQGGGCHLPVGDTDSEAVFCAILNALNAEFHSLPTLPLLHRTIRKLCQEIISGHDDETIFNFLLGCGPYTLFAFSWPGKRPGSQVWNGLYYIVREAPFSTASLIDVDYSIDFSKVTTPSNRVAVITTKPLTDEKGWKEFRKGELLMFDHGLPYAAPEKCVRVEREGRGLFSKMVPKMPCDYEYDNDDDDDPHKNNDVFFLSTSAPSRLGRVGRMGGVQLPPQLHASAAAAAVANESFPPCAGAS